MKNLINTKSTPDIKPDNSGEINQEATVLKKKTNPLYSDLETK